VARPHGLAATFGGLGVGTAGYAAPEQSLPDTTSLAPYTDVFGLDLGIRTGVAFLVGAACSMASGIIGMFVAVRSNVRTASAARRSLVEAVQVAMRGGAVSGFLVVALSLLGVWAIFALYGGFDHPAQAPFLIVGFGSRELVALFAQLGGASTPRPPTWARTSWARSRPGSRRTTPATRA
jgi:hypothetical protein